MDWLEQALCRDIHVDLFYPPLEAKDPNDYYRISKAICNNCPVWSECLKEAISAEEKWGCWGGLTPQERKAPTKVPHGTIERYRLGCRCSSCIDTPNNTVVQIDIERVPRNGQHFDITELPLKLHWNGD